ncbi:hypothetical protein [Priestia aryabhattai]|uniref:hypothetical protein n=1 Tax=Priestia aryabhattai TaxID=412384 RepID=UPI00187537F5|nr:hypothetical protein [Priestia aryabhattai]MBE5103314.1 hypothetical protein [Priestia aryabhattai]
MNKNDTNQLAFMDKIKETASILPSTDVIKFIKVLGEAYTENQITEREIAKIHAQREVLLSEIRRKYDLYEKVFEQIFSERKVAIHKSFEVIDIGLETNDRELIVSGLHSLSKVVSSSPFTDLQKLSSALESNNIIEI